LLEKFASGMFLCKLLRMTKKVPRPLPGYPWEGKFQTKDEVRAYLDETKVTCLLCGRKYILLANHIAHGHDVCRDDYKKRYGIPWSYGLAGKEYREFNYRLGKKLSSEGIIPRPSQESISRMLEASGKRLRRDEEPSWNRYKPQDYEEYLRRIASCRTVADVGNDKDMPDKVLFYRYIKAHPEFKEKFIATLDTLPYPFQAQMGKTGKSFQRDVVSLRQQGLTWIEIGQRLGVRKHAVQAAYKKFTQLPLGTHEVPGGHERAA
jgi:hypothetical protein